MGADVVRAEYAQLEQMARTFSRQSDRVERLLRTVDHNVGQLRGGAWVGRGMAAFLAEMDGEVGPALQRLGSALEQAGTTIAEIIAVLQAAEAEAALLFQGEGANDAAQSESVTEFGLDHGADVGDDHGTASNSKLGGGSASSTGFSIWQFLTVFPFIPLTNDLSHFSLEMIAGNADHLAMSAFTANLLRSGACSHFLAISDGIFGAIDDWNQRRFGDDLVKTIGVNGIDVGIQSLIGLTLPGKVALLANTGVQILGALDTVSTLWQAELAANGAMRGIMLDNAASMETAYTKTDLTNITKELSIGIWNGYEEAYRPAIGFYQATFQGLGQLAQNPSLETLVSVTDSLNRTAQENPPNPFLVFSPLAPLVITESGRTGLVDTAKAAGRVVDGLADWTVIHTGQQLEMNINDVLRATEALPISSDLKAGITNAAMTGAQTVHHVQDWTTSLVDF